MKHAALLLLLAAGCPADPVVTGSIEGRVLLRNEDNVTDATTVRVTVDGPQYGSAAVEADGSFLFADLPPGEYVVEASLGLWSREGAVRVTVGLAAGQVAHVPDLVLTPAGTVIGSIEVEGGLDPEGYRVQILGTELTAVSIAMGDFAIHRVAGGVYEIVAEKAEVGSARRAGVIVAAFVVNDLGTLTVIPGAQAFDNQHPRFAVTDVIFTGNGAPEDAAIRALPYAIPVGAVRRFDRVRLEAPAVDDDGDTLSYEWSATAGGLISPFEEVAWWRPDELAGSRATLSVTVRDGHGGIARVSTDIDVVDVFAGTADRELDMVVHSYRIEGGPWRIDLVDLTDDTIATLLDLPGDDPRPVLVDSYVVYRRDGELWALDIEIGSSAALGLVPAADTPAEPMVRGSGPYLLVVDQSTPSQLSRVELATGFTSTTLSCSFDCVAIAVDGSDIAAIGSDGTTITFAKLGGGLISDQFVSGGVGTGIALAGTTAAFVYGDSGRSYRNSAGLQTTGSSPRTFYTGYYDMIVWAFDGDYVFITEQEYRSLYHMPFVRLLQRGIGVIGDLPIEGEPWQADRVFDARDGVALVRRLAAADWPASSDSARSEIVRARYPEAFQ